MHLLHALQTLQAGIVTSNSNRIQNTLSAAIVCANFLLTAVMKPSFAAKPCPVLAIHLQLLQWHQDVNVGRVNKTG